ncbi:MAG: VIT1/CCC1 transporter family protein [Nocardioidaceae bacterium]
MAADERIHEEVVRGLAIRGRNRLSGSFRAAVFGANDGLVSNLALVLGISASGASQQIILITGLAGLLAGALSMGAGEYVSVRSQRELLEASSSTPERCSPGAPGHRRQRAGAGVPRPRHERRGGRARGDRDAATAGIRERRCGGGGSRSRRAGGDRHRLARRRLELRASSPPAR